MLSRIAFLFLTSLSAQWFQGENRAVQSLVVVGWDRDLTLSTCRSLLSLVLSSDPLVSSRVSVEGLPSQRQQGPFGLDLSLGIGRKVVLPLASSWQSKLLHG